MHDAKLHPKGYIIFAVPDSTMSYCPDNICPIHVYSQSTHSPYADYDILPTKLSIW